MYIAIINKKGKIMKKSIILCLLFYSFGYSIEYLDVIHLQTGDIVKGTITENSPNEYVKIQLQGGSIFTYQYSEIKKFTKEVVSEKQNDSMNNAQQMMMYESQKKSEGTAMIFSCLLSSSGHAYAGNWVRGLTFTGATVGFYIAAFTLGIEENCYTESWGYSNYQVCNYEPNGFYALGLIGAAVTRIWEIVDAGREVKKYNLSLQKKIYGSQPGFGMNIIPQNHGASLRLTYNF